MSTEFGSILLPPRFWERVREREDGCWEWTGLLTEAGYGRASSPFKTQKAHRWAYLALVGPADGLGLDHLCHNRDAACLGGIACPHRRCVNPVHLEPVTNAVNVLRGKTLAGRHKAKTHCPDDHEYTPENTLTDSLGRRSCRRCQRNRRQAQRMYDVPVVGELHHLSKLTADQVRACRLRSASGESYCSLAKEFEVSRQSMRSLCLRHTWKHVA